MERPLKLSPERRGGGSFQGRLMKKRQCAYLIFSLLAVTLGNTSATTAVSPKTNPDSASGEKIPADTQVWKTTQAAFEKQLARVKKGWTEKRLREYAGKPNVISPGEIPSTVEWYYHWSENGPRGGMFAYYVFSLRDGVVIKIRQGGGCKIKPRGDRGGDTFRKSGNSGDARW
jgi:hypothetical protein